MKKKSNLRAVLRVCAAFLTVIALSVFTDAQAQVLYDGVDCNAIPSAHGTASEWGAAMATDIDTVNPGSSDIEKFWAQTEGDYLYFAFSRRSGGNAGFTFYANTDCDDQSGDKLHGGADWAIHFSIQTGVVQDDTVYRWDPSTGVTGDFIATTYTFNAIIGGSSCVDSSDEKFFELRFPVTDLFDPCQTNCSDFTIEIGTTNAGGSFKSAVKDGFQVNIPIFVNEPPQSIATFDADICSGETITLDGSSSKYNVNGGNGSVADSIVTYYWDLDNDGIWETTGKTVNTNSFTGNGSHTFGLKVEDSYGCLDSTTANVINSHANPSVDFAYDIDSSFTFCKDFEYDFYPVVTYASGSSAGSFEWTLDANAYTNSGSGAPSNWTYSYPFCLWGTDGNGDPYDKDVHLEVTDNWGCSATHSSTIVPVDLVYFTGVVDGDAAVLSWQTATEVNSDYFIIEKSLDGINYEQIGMVKAAGMSMELQNYQFVDPSMNKGDNFYRLSQFDYDGASETFEPIVLNAEEKENSDISVTPNPTRDNVVVTLPVSKVGGELQVIDMTGRVLINKTVTSNRAVSSLSINVSELPEGIYYVRFGNAKEGYVSKMIQLL